MSVLKKKTARGLRYIYRMYIGDEILLSFIGIILNQYNDP